VRKMDLNVRRGKKGRFESAKQNPIPIGEEEFSRRVDYAVRAFNGSQEVKADITITKDSFDHIQGVWDILIKGMIVVSLIVATIYVAVRI